MEIYCLEGDSNDKKRYTKKFVNDETLFGIMSKANY